MQKTVPTPGRLLVMVGFALSCFGLLLFLWLAFGGAVPLKPKGYRFDISFVDATQLAQEADVRISGVPVGKVKAIETTDEGRSRATIEMDPEYAPVPRDSRAMLRQKTLLGETYVELTPGTRGGPTVPENGLLPITEVSEMVELDEIVRAFDAPTRQAFRTWMDSQARSVRGRSKDISDALATLDPFAEDTRKLLQILDSQEGAVRSLISSTGEVFGALSERRGELAGLIENSNRVFATTAERREDL
jgi:phospholipid/cholesterol/gamma-HCH transport system substrate-binding protein